MCNKTTISNVISLINNQNNHINITNQIGSVALFDYQIDAIKESIEMISRYNGVMISDVVGLGKTYTSLGLLYNLKYKKATVIAPPHLINVWKKSIAKMEFDNKIDIVSNHQTEKIDSMSDVYIIDESHKFRNQTAKRYKALQQKIKKSNARVILLTATPINNNLMELYSQINLFLKDDSLNLSGILSVGNSLKHKFSEYDKAIKSYNNNIYNISSQYGISRLLDDIKNTVLSKIMVRRTRKNIVDLYNNDIVFPIINPPVNIQYNIGNIVPKTISLLDKILDNNDKIKTNHLVKLFLLKRLDSSYNSFYETLVRVNNTYSNIFNEIIEIWNPFLNEQLIDNKYNKLLDVVNKNNNKKIVIFSEYIDTAKYVYNQLQNKYRVLYIDSSNREAMTEVLYNEFDATSENQTNDYDVLVTTDTLSEGVNLHRSNFLINYDITWNPQRVTQRVGRLNRVAKQQHSTIEIFNFTSNDIINSIMKLNDTVDSKVFLTNSLIGNDNQLIFDNEIIFENTLFNLDNITTNNELLKKYQNNSAIDNKKFIININNETIKREFEFKLQEYNNFILLNANQIKIDLLMGVRRGGVLGVPTKLIDSLFNKEFELLLLSANKIEVIDNHIIATNNMIKNLFSIDKQSMIDREIMQKFVTYEYDLGYISNLSKIDIVKHLDKYSDVLFVSCVDNNTEKNIINII